MSKQPRTPEEIRAATKAQLAKALASQPRRDCPNQKCRAKDSLEYDGEYWQCIECGAEGRG